MASSSLTGSLVSQAQSSLLEAQQERMVQQLKSQQGTANDGKIEKSAQEFESMLLSNWLQQAEQSMATVPGAEDDEDIELPEDRSEAVGQYWVSLSGSIGFAA